MRHATGVGERAGRFGKTFRRHARAKIGMMVVVAVFYIVLGSFLKSLTMILITVPVFAPLAQGLGYDLIWFGVLLDCITGRSTGFSPFRIRPV